MGAEADPQGPFKLARMDAFPARHIDFESPMTARGLASAIMYNGSGRSDGNIGNSSSSTLSPGGFLRGYNLSSMQARPPKADEVGSLLQMFAGGPQSSSVKTGSLSYQDFIPTQVPSSRSDGARNTYGGLSGPFTAEQWLEFSQQTYVFKHLAAGVKPPPALILPIVSRVSTASRFGANSLHAGNNAVGFGTGSQGNADPEPGRCRRTDGKKWRCARDVVQDQKYCERHMHRGRHRSRAKNAEAQVVTTSQSTGTVVSSVSNAPSGSVDDSSAVENANCGSSSTVGRLVPLSQQVVATAASDSRPQPFYSAGAHGLSSAIFPKTVPASSSLALSREGQLHFSLHPSGISDDASRGCLRPVNSNLRPDQFLTSDASELKRLLEGAHGAGNLPMRNMLSTKTPTDQLTNVATDKESTPNIYTMSHLTNHFNASNATKTEHISHHACLSAADMGGLNGGREADDLPFRQFMNDWPRSRDSPSLSWCDLDEQQNSSKTASSTELSISNHMTMNLPFASIASSRLKQSSSPLRLSMMRVSGDDLLEESVDMGLSMGVGVASADESRDRQQSSWVPIAWDSPLVGGPLAEVLHSSSTPRGHSSSSLNLLGDGWEYHHHLQLGSPKESNSASLASPTDVLQKTMFGSYADSSSSGSSPRSAPKAESRFGDTV